MLHKNIFFINLNLKKNKYKNSKKCIKTYIDKHKKKNEKIHF